MTAVTLHRLLILPMGLRDRDLVPGRKKNTKGSLISAVLLALLVGWGIRMILHRFIWTPVAVSEASMQPALQEGDVVTIHRRFEPGNIQSGKLIWFSHPMNGEQRMIRRVIAVAGDRVEVKRGAVLVNGKVFRESTYREQIEEQSDEKKTSAKKDSPALIQASFFDRPEITVQNGTCYVLADGEGLDSRHFGVVPMESILGLLP